MQNYTSETKRFGILYHWCLPLLLLVKGFPIFFYRTALSKLNGRSSITTNFSPCSVLEVKKIPARGTTIDVILANGILQQGDTIIVCGITGQPMITTIKALLLPPPATEIRVKTDYEQVKEVRASIGCKIEAAGLDQVLPGPLFVIQPGENYEEYKEEVIKCYLKGKIKKSDVGVYVQALTLGSMEALLAYLKDCNIPVSGLRIGPVYKKDVMRASIMHEKKYPQYAVILAFDVHITTEAKDHADKLNVRIFEADIIYHLFDAFSLYVKELQDKRKKELEKIMIFPCRLKVLGKDRVIRRSDPIICCVKVEQGILKTGTPLIVLRQGIKLELGIVTCIETDTGFEIPDAEPGSEVCIKIVQTDPSKQKYHFGRHFQENDLLYSQLTPQSIDALTELYPDIVKYFQDCIREIKKILGIHIYTCL